MKSNRNALHLFCFARKELLPDRRSIMVDPSGARPDISILVDNGVAAIYNTVLLEDFTGPGAEDRFSNLEWLGPRAIFHEKVVEDIARYSPVLPAPFGTIYLSTKNLEGFLHDHLETISAFLEFVSDKREWAVKGYMDHEKSSEAVQRLMLENEKKTPVSPGAKYLHERRLRETASGKMGGWLGQILSSAEQLLSMAATKSRRRPPLPESDLDESARMVANWAFLIAKADEPRIESTINRLNDQHRDEGIFFRISGPWPPFSFTPQLESGPQDDR